MSCERQLSESCALMRRHAVDEYDLCNPKKSALSSSSSFSRSRNSGSRSKRQQVEITLNWLEENYVSCEGVCLPRFILYTHYLDFCRKNQLTPSCAATFGKVSLLRNRDQGDFSLFPHCLHWKGSYKILWLEADQRGWCLVLRTFSKFKEPLWLQRPTLDRTGTLLPDFPNPHLLDMSTNVDIAKLEVFLVMYKTHCQCVLDNAITRNYSEIRDFIMHFWQGIPTHLLSVLEAETVVDIICLCDSILFKVLVDVLVPTTLYQVDDGMLMQICSFAQQLEAWITVALDGLKRHLQERKLSVVRRFVQSISRQTSFLHHAKAVWIQISQRETSLQLAFDLETLGERYGKSMLIDSGCVEVNVDVFCKVLYELYQVLKKDNSVEDFLDFVERNLEERVMKNGYEGKETSTGKLAHGFLASWNAFDAVISRSLAEESLVTAGTFNLISRLIFDYVWLVIESHADREWEKGLQFKLERMCKDTGYNTVGVQVSQIVTTTKFGATGCRMHEGVNTSSKVLSSKRKIKRKYTGHPSPMATGGSAGQPQKCSDMYACSVRLPPCSIYSQPTTFPESCMAASSFQPGHGYTSTHQPHSARPVYHDQAVYRGAVFADGDGGHVQAKYSRSNTELQQYYYNHPQLTVSGLDMYSPEAGPDSDLYCSSLANVNQNQFYSTAASLCSNPSLMPTAMGQMVEYGTESSFFSSKQVVYHDAKAGVVDELSPMNSLYYDDELSAHSPSPLTANGCTQVDLAHCAHEQEKGGVMNTSNPIYGIFSVNSTLACTLPCIENFPC